MVIRPVSSSVVIVVVNVTAVDSCSTGGDGVVADDWFPCSSTTPTALSSHVSSAFSVLSSFPFCGASQLSVVFVVVVAAAVVVDSGVLADVAPATTDLARDHPHCGHRKAPHPT